MLKYTNVVCVLGDFMAVKLNMLLSASSNREDIIVLNILITVLVIIAIIFVSVPIVFFFLNFTKELRYLNLEIKRSYGKEREHFKKIRKQYLLSLIPFIKIK